MHCYYFYILNFRPYEFWFWLCGSKYIFLVTLDWLSFVCFPPVCVLLFYVIKLFWTTTFWIKYWYSVWVCFSLFMQNSSTDNRKWGKIEVLHIWNFGWINKMKRKHLNIFYPLSFVCVVNVATVCHDDARGLLFCPFPQVHNNNLL